MIMTNLMTFETNGLPPRDIIFWKKQDIIWLATLLKIKQNSILSFKIADLDYSSSVIHSLGFGETAKGLEAWEFNPTEFQYAVYYFLKPDGIYISISKFPLIYNTQMYLMSPLFSALLIIWKGLKFFFFFQL